MASLVPTVLILGHSFIKRLKRNLESVFDPCVDGNFHLQGSVSVHMFGVGGRTVSKLRKHDLHDILILEIGTNDHSQSGPEVVGPEIEDLVLFLHNGFTVQVICISHGESYLGFACFNSKASVLNQFIRALLEQFENVFCWYHKGFSNPSNALFLADGVHLNPTGQYH